MMHNKYKLEKILLTIENRIATLSFNDPKTIHSLGNIIFTEIQVALDVVERFKNDIDCLILTGTRGMFSSGANIEEVSLFPDYKDVERIADIGTVLESSANPVVRRLQSVHCPIISAISGPCVGAAIGFALCGDYIIASDTAYFYFAFLELGLLPDCGVSWFLPRLVGLQRAKSIIMFAEKVPADEALNIGLINQLCPKDQMQNEIDKITQKFISLNSLGQKYARQMINQSMTSSLEDQLNCERQLQKECGQSEYFYNKRNDFLEKKAKREEIRNKRKNK